MSRPKPRDIEAGKSYFEKFTGRKVELLGIESKDSRFPTLSKLKVQIGKEVIHNYPAYLLDLERPAP